MPLREECVEFKNHEGMTLRGVLHYANLSKTRDISVVLLNTGLNDMVGWHRIQVKVARILCANGYTALRFDDAGIGDSDGDINKESVVEIFSDIETGLFTQNAEAAVEFLKRISPDQKIVLLGFCGGGLTAMHTAARNDNITGIIDIGGPVTLSSRDYLQQKDPWEVQRNIEKYRRKLFKLRPWLNFFTFRGEYKVIYRSVMNYIRHKLKGEYKETLDSNAIAEVKNLNREFFISFEKYAKSKRPCLFFFAEHDSATWEFKKYFLAHYQNSELWDEKNFTFFEADGANHIISSNNSQSLLNEHILRFLDDL